ncbi:MAG: hypothetical protein K6E20_00200 [Acholeplasmatales bacterium]|nr:hypothetical protein [Acholeplasmatales bacterium]
MTIEQMLKILGVRTQSRESIDLCYQMDLEAFNMMSTNEYDFSKERKQFEAVYFNLLDEIGYQTIDKDTKCKIEEIINNIEFKEEDTEYRDLYFTGLERTLLRFNRFDLVRFQRIPMSDHDGIAKDAYLYELSGDYAKAMRYYNLIGESERFDVCIQKTMA